MNLCHVTLPALLLSATLAPAFSQQAPLIGSDGLPLPTAAADDLGFVPSPTPAPDATGLDVAIVAAASSSSSGCHFTDLRDKLLATGQYRSVDIVNVSLFTPTLAQLMPYDAVISWTNSTPADFNAWGDVMADYVDAGGGVVVAVFANSSTTAGRHIGGRWVTGGYEVIVSQSGNSSGSATLGALAQPGHPVMTGVATFSGGTSGFRPSGTALTAGSNLVASWSDGKVLVAEGGSPKRIDLGFYPPSSDCISSFWDSTTDGLAMMANALDYVGQGSTAGFCTAKTNLVCGTPAISASGSPSATAASGFTVSAGPARSNKSGILLYHSAPLVSGAPFQGGTLCVESMGLRRAGPTNSQGTGCPGPATCDGQFDIDMNAFAQGLWVVPDCAGAPSGTLPNNPAGYLTTPGIVVSCQYWGRDSVASGSFVSDGLQYTIAP